MVGENLLIESLVFGARHDALLLQDFADSLLLRPTENGIDWGAALADIEARIAKLQSLADGIREMLASGTPGLPTGSGGGPGGGIRPDAFLKMSIPDATNYPAIAAALAEKDAEIATLRLAWDGEIQTAVSYCRRAEAAEAALAAAQARIARLEEALSEALEQWDPAEHIPAANETRQWLRSTTEEARHE